MQIIQDHSQHLRYVKSYILHVSRVLLPPLSEITVTCKLMHGYVRDFPLSIMKNVESCKKNKENQGYSINKEQCAMGKKTNINS